MQFLASKQLLPQDKDARKLRDILKEAGNGKQTDQSEVNAAVGRNTMYILPVMIFLFTVNIASALSLYWLVGGIVAYIQQGRVLRVDETEMETLADKPSKKDVSKIVEAEVVTRPKAKNTSSPKSKNKKRRKR